VRILKALKFCLGIGLALSATIAPLRAAELRIDFRELATLTGGFLNTGQIRLHNAPGGMLDFSSGSSITIAGTEKPIPVPVRSFDVGGTKLAYMLNDINSTGIEVSAVPGAVRLSVTFEEEGPEFTGHCLSANLFCPTDAALPQIEWQGAALTLDFQPVRVGNSLALKAVKAEIKGKFEPHCVTSSATFSGSICRIALGQARAAIARFRKDLDAALVAKINESTVQEKIASFLKGHLVFGPGGDVNISKVTVDSEGRAVIVSFCLAC
jgi:hypothetical protein